MEGFGERLFGRESSGVAAEHGGFSEGFAVVDLVWGEDTISEAITVFSDDLLDAGDLDEVGADAIDGHFLTRVSVHQFTHLGHGVVKTDGERARNEMMADVELCQIGNVIEIGDIGAVDAVSCVDL